MRNPLQYWRRMVVSECSIINYKLPITLERSGNPLGEYQSIKNNKLCETNPISEKPKMNVTSILTKDYENERLCRCGENKPNQTQFPKSQNALKKDYTASGRAVAGKNKSPYSIQAQENGRYWT